MNDKKKVLIDLDEYETLKKVYDDKPAFIVSTSWYGLYGGAHTVINTSGELPGELTTLIGEYRQAKKDFEDLEKVPKWVRRIFK